MVVGADAVGVACLSGPVLAAAVVMPAYGRRIPGVRDSKMLSRAQRERLYPQILRGARRGRPRRGQRGRDRPDQHLPRHEPRHAPSHLPRGGARARPHRRAAGVSARGVRRPLHGHRPRRRALLLDRRRLDRGQGRPRSAHGPPRGAATRTTAGSTTPATPPSTHRRGIEEHGITPFHRRSFARVRAVEIGEQMELDLPPERLDALARARARRGERGGKPPVIAAVHADEPHHGRDGRPAPRSRPRGRGSRRRLAEGAVASCSRAALGRPAAARSTSWPSIPIGSGGGRGPRPPHGAHRRGARASMRVARHAPRPHAGRRFAAGPRVGTAGCASTSSASSRSPVQPRGAGACGASRASTADRPSAAEQALEPRDRRDVRPADRVDPVAVGRRLALVVGGQHEVAVPVVRSR